MDNVFQRESVGRVETVRAHLSTRLAVVFGALAYLIALMSISLYLNSPAYQAYNYPVQKLGLEASLLVLPAAILPALTLPLDFDRPSEIVCWFLFIVAYIPAIALPYMFIGPKLSMVPFTVTLALCMTGLPLIYGVPLHDFHLSLSPRIFWPAVAVGGLLAAIILQALIGLETDLQGIYTAREGYKTALAALGPIAARIASYSLGAFSNVIAPLLLVYGLERRDGRGAIAAVGGLVILGLVFALAGYKTMLFIPLATIGLYLAFSDRGRWVPSLTGLAASAAIVIPLAIHVLTGHHQLLSTFRRFAITPGIITGAYIDYFTGRPLTLFAERSFMPFIEYPYGQLPSYLIGEEYFGQDVHANVNLWAEGYMSFGLAGVIGMTLLLAGTLWLYDSLSVGLETRVAAALLCAFLTKLAYTSLVNTYITHGLLLLMVAVALYPRRKQSGYLVGSSRP